MSGRGPSGGAAVLCDVLFCKAAAAPRITLRGHIALRLPCQWPPHGLAPGSLGPSLTPPPPPPRLWRQVWQDCGRGGAPRERSQGPGRRSCCPCMPAHAQQCARSWPGPPLCTPSIQRLLLPALPASPACLPACQLQWGLVLFRRLEDAKQAYSELYRTVSGRGAAAAAAAAAIAGTLAVFATVSGAACMARHVPPAYCSPQPSPLLPPRCCCRWCPS